MYAACKGGIIAFTKTLARELARQGVTLNAVCPGPTDTPLFRDFQAGFPEGTEIADAQARAIPLRRLGQPDDYPGIIAFLLSDDAAYMALVDHQRVRSSDHGVRGTTRRAFLGGPK